MTNAEVVREFLRGRQAKSSTGNLWTTGDRLFSYRTCIAQRLSDVVIIVNDTRYSATTSTKHQSPLRNQLRDSGKFMVLHIKDCPWEILDLKSRLEEFRAYKISVRPELKFDQN